MTPAPHVLALLALVSAGAALWVTVRAWAARHRWGVRSAGTVPAGRGVYRSGEAIRFERRQVPPLVLLGAVAAAVWSALTLLVFVPGLALAWMLPGSAPTLLAFLLSVSGIAVAFVLLRAASRLVRRHDEVREAVRWAVNLGSVHHLGMWASVVIAAMSSTPSLLFFFITAGWMAVPCVIGLLVCWMVHRAAEEVDAIDRATQALDGDLARARGFARGEQLAAAQYEAPAGIGALA